MSPDPLGVLMPEPEKYVTPDQMRDVVERITALGLGGGGGASQSQVDALQAKVDAMPALAVDAPDLFAQL